MEIPHLIYCAAGNKRFAQIALDAGFKFGAQLPGTVYHPVFFADQDWRKPNRERYMSALQEHRPHMATVLDWERHEQLDEVLSWAEEAAQFVDKVIIIPKVFSGIPLIPEMIAGKQVILGYSVPTKYAGTSTPVWEFGKRPVHLLGGSPHKQMEMAYYLNVASADGNYLNKMATRNCQFWVAEKARWASNPRWPTLQEADGEMWGRDAPHEAFKRSCKNFMKAWASRFDVEAKVKLE